jgi:hypothetical protein
MSFSALHYFFYFFWIQATEDNDVSAADHLQGRVSNMGDSSDVGPQHSRLCGTAHTANGAEAAVFPKFKTELSDSAQG